MTSSLPDPASIHIRALQQRDLDEVERLLTEGIESENPSSPINSRRQLQNIRRWYGLLKGLQVFPSPLRNLFRIYVAEQDNRLRGMIHVSPFNRTRSTWRVDFVAVDPTHPTGEGQLSPIDVGSQLLRYCLQTIWEARTWLTEINVNDNFTLPLYRQNGFQPLAQMTYWSIEAEQLEGLAEREPDLPNLLPISNADACLLHQLDTVSMPPLVRQVFDRHILDFKTSLFGAVFDGLKHWVNRDEVVRGYVFEPQRKAAIGYFQLHLGQDSTEPHSAQLTVHPAYTWLYPELLAQMARVAKTTPKCLCLASTDYQPEREEYLEQIGAQRTEHTLMMSRSVWHKLREAKPVSLEGLQLSEVLQSLQPSRKPVPGRFSLLESIRQLPQMQVQSKRHQFAPEQDRSSAAQSDSSASSPPPKSERPQ